MLLYTYRQKENVEYLLRLRFSRLRQKLMQPSTNKSLLRRLAWASVAFYLVLP